MNIHPDVISYTSVVFASLAALAFWQSGLHHWLLIAAPLLCYLRLWCNMLDGMVAMAASKASLRGEILNDLPDRISDVIIFVGVAHSGLCSPFSGYWAAIFALLTAYVGTLGQAVGTKREFSGIMSKPLANGDAAPGRVADTRWILDRKKNHPYRLTFDSRLDMHHRRNRPAYKPSRSA